MSKLRDHEPISITDFNGLWARGDYENTPLDHFQDSNNLRHVGTNSIRTRDGIGISQTVSVPLSNVKRIYNFPQPTGNTLIVLVFDPDTGDGSIHHVVNATTTFGPLLTITGMTDFAFLPYAGRGYISPFTDFTTGDLIIQKGLENEFLYVYAGDGTPARKAAGDPLSGNLTIANGTPGNTDAGFHLFGFVAETSSGYLTAPGAIKGFTTLSNFSVSFGTVPTSDDPNIIARHLVATKVIQNFTGDLTGYTFFFVPNATIPNDTDAFLNNISFFDADLLDDASHLLDNFAEISAGANLSLYHDRLCLGTTFDQITVVYISAQGEPEAISQVDGLIAMIPDGNPITNSQEMRDILYVTKRSKTDSFTDNGDVPSSWPRVTIDTALGTSVHGIATVLDSGGSSVDFLIMATFQGISLFNGRYVTPELSWKIEAFWKAQDRNQFGRIQIVNAPIQKEIYIVIPDKRILVGRYANGMDPKKMQWEPWSFVMGINSVAIHNIDTIIIGADIN